MTCELAFLSVGNADCIIVSPPDESPVVVIDIPRPRVATDWLRNSSRSDIGAIYITHAHRDHFAPLVKFSAFLEQWIGAGGTVSNLFLAEDTIKSAFDDLFILEKEIASSRNALVKKNSKRKYDQLRHALDRLESFGENAIHIGFDFRRTGPSYSRDDLSVWVLHPGVFFSAKHSSRVINGLNERSLVLRISYGDFVAILLADLEGQGLAECLNMCSDKELRAHLVKIPHHGAWPTNGSDLETILRRIDAEIAVLSVGSKNTYGHVAPELFSLLLTLKEDGSSRLSRFLCTEVTRTCRFSSLERAAMGKAGLPNTLPCAGDISILAESSGEWEVKTQTNHTLVVSGVAYAACENRADL